MDHAKRSPAPAAGGRAFEPPRELIDRLYRAAWAICGSAHDADDLVQETFARFLARPRVLHNEDPTPYLLQAMRNTYLTGLRTASRRPRTAELPVDESSTMESSIARPEVALEHRQTLEAIAALAPEFREALVAVDILGLSYREAADSMGTREATIATRLFRARQSVARMLSLETGAAPWEAIGVNGVNEGENER